MNNYEKIIDFVKKNAGYIRSKDVKNLSINSTFLSNLVNDGKLERIDVGVYKLPEYPTDNFYVVSQSSKNMCYSHATSLYLHNLSDRISLTYDVTVPYNYSGSLLDDDEVSLRYVKYEIFKLGMTEVKTVNNLKVSCYDLERTICDIIKDKNHMDIEIYAKALKEYTNSKDKDLLKLAKYAKKLGVEHEVTEAIEVLL